MPRTLNHSRERSCFCERDVPQLLSKKHRRGFFHATYCHSAALAQIDLVAIERKDVFLRETPFKRERQHRFGILALQRLLRREIRVFDELLRDRRTALAQPFITRISQQRTP